MANRHREKEELTIRRNAQKSGREAESTVTTKGSRVVDLRKIVAAKQQAEKRAQVRKRQEIEHAHKRFWQKMPLQTLLHRLVDMPERRTRTQKNTPQSKKPMASTPLGFEENAPLVMEALTDSLTNGWTAVQSGSRRRVKHMQRNSRSSIAQVQHFFASLVNPLLAGLPAHSRSTIRTASAFFLVLCIIVVPASTFGVVSAVNTKEEQLTAGAEQAFAQLQAAGESVQNVNFEQALSEFSAAEQTFAGMQDQLNGLTGVMIGIAQYLPGKGDEIAAGRVLIRAGNEISKAGSALATAGQTASSISAGYALSGENGVADILAQLNDSLTPAAEHLHTARVLVDGIAPSSVPASKRALFTTAQTQLPVADSVVTQLRDLAGASSALLGKDTERRYMIVFQNNRELRPTGGFMGSYAVVTVRDGLVTSLDAPGGGIYDVAGQLQEKLESPQPLHLVNPHWNIQDANWFPNFPDSAKKIQWFYERSNGGSLDGVMTFTPDVIEKLLEVTGPIALEEFDTTVNAQNVRDLLAQRDPETDTAVDGEEPKKLIATLTPKLLNAVIEKSGDPQTALKIVLLLKQSLDEKNILVAVNNEDVQDVFRRYDWAGEIQQTDGDYLYVNHANIAGGKTDGVIDEMIRQKTEIKDDGSVVNHVEITRAHKGRASVEAENVLNVSYVRVYVPEGSQLLAASGFDMPLPNQFLQPDDGAQKDADLQRITGTVLQNNDTKVAANNEFGKTVFGGWMRTSVGESTTVTLTYTLPTKIQVGDFWNPYDSYSLLVQKQPGMSAPFFVHELALPDSLQATAEYPASTETSVTAGPQTRRTLSHQVLLTDDYVTGAVIQPATK